MITEIKSSSPPSECSGSGAPPLGGALPPIPGRRAAPRRRDDGAHVAPFGAQWNGTPESPEPATPSSRFFIRATIIADQLETLRQILDENRDVLSLGEVAQGYQLIDEARRVSLHSLKDQPASALGARLNVRV